MAYGKAAPKKGGMMMKKMSVKKMGMAGSQGAAKRGKAPLKKQK